MRGYETRRGQYLSAQILAEEKKVRSPEVWYFVEMRVHISFCDIDDD